VPETDTQGEELRETIEYYLVHDQVPADVREDVVALYDDGEYRRALELALNDL
jgi:hypothetical protein